MARAEAREMVLSFRALFLVIVYLLLAGGIGRVFTFLDEKSEGQLSAIVDKAAELPEVQREQLIDELAVKGGLGRSLAEAVISGDLPPLVFFVLFLSTFILPALILLVGFNRISEDVTSRFTRYVLQRVHRGSYLVGKVFGHWLVSYLAIIAVHLILLTYATTTELVEAESTWSAMPPVWAGLALFVLAYVSFNAMFSSMLNPPIAALLVSFVALCGLWFAPRVLSLFYAPLGRVWMGSWDTQLWALDPAATGIYLGYSAVFLAAAYWILRRRDL